MEVCRHSGDTDMIILWVRQRSTTTRREEGESLYEADSEQHHLVPSQGLSYPLRRELELGVSYTLKLISRIYLTSTFQSTFHPLQ